MEYLPGQIVLLRGADMAPSAEVEVELYLRHERSYKVWWTYPQTGERELIKVPEWRLVRKEKKR